MLSLVSLVFLLLYCFFPFVFCSTSSSLGLSLLSSFVSVDYLLPPHPNPLSAESMLADGRFIKTHCIITGVKVLSTSSKSEGDSDSDDDDNDVIFVSVPRWLNGVPATLARVVKVPVNANVIVNANDNTNANVTHYKYMLLPFPSITSQALAPISTPPIPNSPPVFVNNTNTNHNVNANVAPIVYVQSFEIDSRNYMWVLDCGQFGLIDGGGHAAGFPVRLSVYDLSLVRSVDNVLSSYSDSSACLLDSYTFDKNIFPSSLSEVGLSFANDLVIDETNGKVYISDTTNQGGIVLYDSNKRAARRFVSPVSMNGVPRFIPINGVPCSVARGTDGIALSHDSNSNQLLLFSTVSADQLWSVRTSVLTDNNLLFNVTIDITSSVTLEMSNKGVSDGLVIDDKNRIYYMNATECALYVSQLNTSVSQSQSHIVPNSTFALFRNCTSFDWIDTFGFSSSRRSLVLTSNRLPFFFTGSLDLNASSNLNDPNFRIWEVAVDALSYLSKTPFPTTLPCSGGGGGGGGDDDDDALSDLGRHIWLIVGSSIALIVLVVVACVCKKNGCCGGKEANEKAKEKEREDLGERLLNE